MKEQFWKKTLLYSTHQDKLQMDLRQIQKTSKRKQSISSQIAERLKENSSSYQGKNVSSLSFAAIENNGTNIIQALIYLNIKIMDFCITRKQTNKNGQLAAKTF